MPSSIQILMTLLLLGCIHGDEEPDANSSRGESSRQAKLLSYITVETEQNLVPSSGTGSIDTILSKLDALQKTTVTKKQITEIKRLVDKGLQVCPWNVAAVKIDGSCYSLFAERKDFLSARATCQAFGGDLAVLNLQDNILHKLRPFFPPIAIDGTHHETWIGAKRDSPGEPYAFLDGTVISLTNGRWNKPNHKHNCVIMDDVDLPKNFIIDDCQCQEAKSFLCQFELIQIL